MGEPIRKGDRNYIGEILLAQYEHFGTVYTFIWLIWCSMNKLSMFASGSIASQYWGNFHGLSIT